MPRTKLSFIKRPDTIGVGEGPKYRVELTKLGTASVKRFLKRFKYPVSLFYFIQHSDIISNFTSKESARKGMINNSKTTFHHMRLQ